MLKTSTPTRAANQTTIHLFYYRNATSRLQVIQVNQAIPHPLKKVVFPGEQILFHAKPEAVLEVHSSITNDLTLVDRVPCAQLQVLE